MPHPRFFTAFRMTFARGSEVKNYKRKLSLYIPNPDKLETLSRDTACRVSTKQIQITNIKTTKKAGNKKLEQNILALS